MARRRQSIANQTALRWRCDTGKNSMTQVVEWFFGRGLSIGCGLHWSVPEVWKAFSREDQVAMITQAIQEEMSAAHTDTRDIEAFLDILATKTQPDWQHRFHTTNWDYLLQREISQRFPTGTVKQCWLASSHVYHHNGTAEMPSGDPFRSNDANFAIHPL